MNLSMMGTVPLVTSEVKATQLAKTSTHVPLGASQLRTVLTSSLVTPTIKMVPVHSTRSLATVRMTMRMEVAMLTG